MLISQWEWRPIHQLSAQIQKHPPEMFHKKAAFKNSQYSQEITYVGVFFYKDSLFIKKRLQTVFVGNIAKHLF